MQAWSARDTRELKDGQGRTEEERIRPVINVVVRELAPLERFLEGGVEGGGGGGRGRARAPPGRRGGIQHARGGPAGAELRRGAATLVSCV